MENLISETDEVKKLKILAASHAEIDWISPAIKTELGALGFHPIVPVLRAYADLVRLLSISDLRHLPPTNATQVARNLNGFHETFKKIQNFSITNANANELRSAILEELKKNYNAVFQSAAPPIAFGRAKSIDIEKIHNSHS